MLSKPSLSVLVTVSKDGSIVPVLSSLYSQAKI